MDNLMQIFVSRQTYIIIILPHVLSTPVKKTSSCYQEYCNTKKSKNDAVTNVKKRSKFDQETSARDVALI